MIVKTYNEFLKNFDPSTGKYSIIGTIGSGKTHTAITLMHDLEAMGYKASYSCPFRELRNKVNLVTGSARTYHGYGFVSILRNTMKNWEVMEKEDYVKFFDMLHIPYNPNIVSSEAYPGNQILVARDSFIHYSLKKPNEDEEGFIKFCKERGYIFTNHGISYSKVLQIIKQLEEYKEKIKKIEYIDMLLIPIRKGYTADFNFIGIFDEFQCATPLIIKFINDVLCPQTRIYVYDLNQFTSYWFGADLKAIRNEVKDSDTFLVLEKSHRVPKQVGERMEKWRKMFKTKDVVKYKPIFEKEGKFFSLDGNYKIIKEYIKDSVRRALRENKTLLIQTRSHNLRRRIVSILLKLGVPFTTVETKRVESLPRILYNAIFKIMNGKPLTETEELNLIRYLNEEGRKLYYKYIITRKPFNVLNYLEIDSKLRSKILNMLFMDIKTTIPEEPLISVLTMNSSLGLTADINVIIERKKLYEKKEYDNLLRVLYTSVGRTNKECFIFWI